MFNTLKKGKENETRKKKRRHKTQEMTYFLFHQMSYIFLILLNT